MEEDTRRDENPLDKNFSDLDSENKKPTVVRSQIEAIKDEAIELWKKGCNIVPTRNKKPICDWKKWITERQSFEELNLLLWDECDGIAIIMGQKLNNGYYLCCIDFDVRDNNKEAVEKGRKVIEFFPKTYEETTPRGGKHLFFYSKTEPETMEQYSKECAVELLGKGHLCNVWPSVGYAINFGVSPVIVEDMNESFIDALKSAGVGIKQKEGFWFDREDLRAVAYSEEDPPCIRKMLEGTTEGNRNEYGIRLASYLLNFRKLNSKIVWEELKRWNERNRPPLPETELSSVFNSAREHGYNYTCSDPILSSLCDEQNCPLKGKVNIGKELSMKELIQTAGELKWVIPALLPENGVVFLAGKAGEGKSILSLYIAKLVTSADAVQDGFPIGKKGKVIIFDRENHPSVIKERGIAFSLSDEENIVYNFSDDWYFDDRNGITALDNYLGKEKPTLCIFDSWTQFISRIDENKAVEVNNVIRRLRKISQEYNCCFLVIHHLRKGLPYAVEALDELRGSSTIVNTADIVLLLRGDSENKLLTTVKSRMSPPKAYFIQLLSKDGRFDIKVQETKYEENTSEIIKAAERVKEYLAVKKNAATRSELLDELGFGRGTLDRALQYLMATGAVERVKKGVYKLKQTELTTEEAM
jgi:hypothetical protein